MCVWGGRRLSRGESGGLCVCVCVCVWCVCMSVCVYICVLCVCMCACVWYSLHLHVVGISSMVTVETEEKPVYALNVSLNPMHCPTFNSTMCRPVEIAAPSEVSLHNPEITDALWILTPLPLTEYTTPSMGSEHSSPSMVINHRAQQLLQPVIRRFPLKVIFKLESWDCFVMPQAVWLIGPSSSPSFTLGMAQWE